MKNNDYVLIQGWMVNELKLRGAQLLCYAIIYSFSRLEEHSFHGSQQHLAEWCGVSRRTINQVVNSLIQKGLVVCSTETKDGKISYNYTIVINDEKEGVKKLHRGCEETSHDKYSIDINKEKHTKEIEIVNFWNEKTDDYPKVAKVSEKVKKAINARLNDGYSVDDIKSAILLMNTLSDFYKGKGDSHWKADFLWLMQNTKGNFEKILAGGLHITSTQKHQYEMVMQSQGTLDPNEYRPVYDEKSEIQFNKKTNHYKVIGKDPRFSTVYDGYNSKTRPDGAILESQYGTFKWSAFEMEWCLI